MFKEIKEEIIKEYDNLAEYYNECADKAEILYKNTKKNKLELTAGLTICAMIPIFIVGISLLQGLGISYINVPLYMASTTALSVLTGYIGQKIITFSAKRKMKKFTNINKNREIIKESALYELEKVKAKKKIEIIDKIYDKVESKENILEEITKNGKYTITENNLSEEELNKNYELMLQNYNNKMQTLDVMVSQEFLRTKFEDYRKNWVRIPNAISNGLMLSILLSFTTGIALMFNKLKHIPVENEWDLIKQILVAFTPSLAVAPMTILSTVRSSNDNLYAFNELNNTLGENALQQKPDKKREANLENNIEKLTNILVQLGYSIKETEYILKEIAIAKNDKEKIQSLEKSTEKTWDDALITVEDIKIYTQESPSPFNHEIVFGEDESLEKKNGKKLVRTLKTNNTSNN